MASDPDILAAARFPTPMAFNPGIAWTGRRRHSLDYRCRRGLDNHLFGNRDAHIDSYADIGGGGDRRSACHNSCKEKFV